MSSVAADSPRRASAAVVASVLGWSLDLFDLFVILYIAPTIGPLFFPSRIPTVSLAAVYASFAVTLLMRPVGSGIFGAYADRSGRKRAMITAVVGVGVATAALGALPTIGQAGLLAPVVFIVVRLIQGIFVGGVVASTHTIGTETVAPRWRGLMSGLIGGGGAAIGGLIASLVFFLVSSAFPGPAFSVWGWRVMFFTGILSAVFGSFLFSSLEESPLWEEARRTRGRTEKAPVRVVFSARYLPVVLVNLAVVAGAGTQYYLTSGYLPSFLGLINHVPKPVAGKILIVASVVVLIAALAVGQLSEAIGRRRALLVTGVANLILIPLTYAALARATSLGAVAAYVMVLSFLGNAAYAPVLIFLNERFPTAIRASGTGLSWNMGFAIGGMMPTFVTLASRSVPQIPAHLSWFLAAAIVLYLAGAVISPETRGRFE
jgi:MHS family proline/betaine transporter-like MFS transporter